MLASLQKRKGRLEYALQKTLRLKIFSNTVRSQNLVRAVDPLHKNMWSTYSTKEWDLRSLASFKPVSQKGKPRLREMSSPGCTNMYGQKSNWVFKIFKSRAMWPGNGSKRYHDFNHMDSLSQTAFNQLSLFCLLKECYGGGGDTGGEGQPQRSCLASGELGSIPIFTESGWGNYREEQGSLCQSGKGAGDDSGSCPGLWSVFEVYHANMGWL